MNENAKKWVAALRSGNYEQGKNSLKNEIVPATEIAPARNKYCCLGVACELAIADGVGIHIEKTSGIYSFDSCNGFLPTKVQDWLGLSTYNGVFSPIPEEDSIFDTLTQHNDRGVPFGEIADIIESEPVGLFSS